MQPLLNISKNTRYFICRKKAENYKVVVNGQIELPVIGNNTDEERNVVEIVHHAEYNPSSLYNDVALLILDEPYVEGKNFLNRICFPPKDVNMEGMRCLVAGWGKEIKETGKYSIFISCSSFTVRVY